MCMKNMAEWSCHSRRGAVRCGSGIPPVKTRRGRNDGSRPLRSGSRAPEEETRGPTWRHRSPRMKAAADTRDDVLRTLRGPPALLHGTSVHLGLGLLMLPARELHGEHSSARQPRRRQATSPPPGDFVPVSPGARIGHGRAAERISEPARSRLIAAATHFDIEWAASEIRSMPEWPMRAA